MLVALITRYAPGLDPLAAGRLADDLWDDPQISHEPWRVGDVLVAMGASTPAALMTVVAEYELYVSGITATDEHGSEAGDPDLAGRLASACLIEHRPPGMKVMRIMRADGRLRATARRLGIELGTGPWHRGHYLNDLSDVRQHYGAQWPAIEQAARDCAAAAGLNFHQQLVICRLVRSLSGGWRAKWQLLCDLGGGGVGFSVTLMQVTCADGETAPGPVTDVCLMGWPEI
jgi:hypothetical protein